MTAEATPARRGRPKVEDKRKLQRIFNGAEWAQVQRDAKALGMTAAAYVRMRLGVNGSQT